MLTENSRLDEHSLVAAVPAKIVAVEEKALDAICGNAGVQDAWARTMSSTVVGTPAGRPPAEQP